MICILCLLWSVPKFVEPCLTRYDLLGVGWAPCGPLQKLCLDQVTVAVQWSGCPCNEAG